MERVYNNLSLISIILGLKNSLMNLGALLGNNNILIVLIHFKYRYVQIQIDPTGQTRFLIKGTDLDL